jgi:hypothetical protein
MSEKVTITVRTHFSYTPVGTDIRFVSLEGALRWLEGQQCARTRLLRGERVAGKGLARGLARLGVKPEREVAE